MATEPEDSATFVQRCTAQIERRAKAVTHRAGRPYQYVARPSLSKEDLACRLARKQGVEKGLVCVLSAVEPRRSFDIYRDRESKRLRLVSRTRKCRFFYCCFIDREFGLMHMRLQSWLPHRILDPVSAPVYKHGQRYRALRPVSPQEARLFAALLASAIALRPGATRS